MLRTHLQAETAEELWSKYMQWTEAEASFRVLKSELSIRPLFHQKEPRGKAHVMVAFLGFALWVTLKRLLERRAPMVPSHRRAASMTLSRGLLGKPSPSSPPCKAPTWSSPPPTVMRSDYAASRNPRPSKNHCFSNSD